jgi:serine/threonine-protein kinase
MGTLTYMSPEQARGETATAASDMYSLGLVLQELFTGEPPYESGLTFAHMLKKAANAETRPVAGLSEDLTRFLNRLKDPIPEARPSSVDAEERMRFLLTKPQRRRRRALIWAAMAACLLIAGVMTWQSFRIRATAEQAERSALAADEVSDFLVNLFEWMEPGQRRGNTITARELLDRGSARLETLTGEPLSRARILLTIGKAYRKMGLYDQAQPLLTEALTIRRELLGDNHLDVAESLLELAHLNQYLDQSEAALDNARSALEIQDRNLGNEHLLVADSLNTLSSIYLDLGENETAEQMARRALAIKQARLAKDHAEVGAAMAWLGLVLDDIGNNAESFDLLSQSLTILENSSQTSDLISALNGLARLHSQEGRYTEAEALYHRALDLIKQTFGDTHQRLAGIYNNIGVLYDNQDLTLEAVPHYERALEIYRNVFGDNHTIVAATEGNLALSYIDLGNYEKALELARRALEVQLELRPDDAGILGFHYLILAHAETGLKNFDQVAVHVEQAIDIARSEKPGNLELLAVNMEYLADNLIEDQQLDLVESLSNTALHIWDRVIDPAHVNVSHNLKRLAKVMRARGQEQEAKRLEQKAESVLAEMDEPTGT